MIMACEDVGTYTVAVRGRCMIAHSFKGECFGPAQALHGCTYVVDAVCQGQELKPEANYLIDICAVEQALHQTLDQYSRSNLDNHPEFVGSNTTCERMALAVWEKVAKALPAPPALDKLKIVVRESDVAHVEYERALGATTDPGLYSVSVRGRFMAARTINAQLQGATFVVDALFSGCELDPAASFLFDICLAEELVSKAAARLHQTNLDNTLAVGTCGREPTSNAIAEGLWKAVAQGLPAGHSLTHLKLAVREHDELKAEFACPLPRAEPPARPAPGPRRGPEPGPEPGPEHTLAVRGRCMIAHSFRGDEFGPAQALHGCTYVVDARYSFGGADGDGSSFGAEHALAQTALNAACAHYHQRNLDALDEFAGENTTCERVARSLWSRIEAVLPPRARERLVGLEVVVRESDVAYVTFRRRLGPPTKQCGTAVLIDVDALEDAQRRAAAAGEGSTPTGIVHRRPLGALTSVLPHTVCAFSRRATADEAKACVTGLGMDAGGMRIALLGPEGAAAASTAECLLAEAGVGEGRTVGVVSSDAAAHAMMAAQSRRVRPIPVVGADFAADRALLTAVGCCTPRKDDAASRVAYLTDKRPIDERAYSRETLRALQEALGEARARKTRAAPPSGGAPAELRVFDLGAGTLSMLPLVSSAAQGAGFGKVRYLAFDSDQSLLDAAEATLTSSGAYRRSGAPAGAESLELVPVHTLISTEAAGGMQVHLELHCEDILALDGKTGTAEGPAPCDLLVGSGFADLLPPSQLATLLPRLCPGGLAYLPITFAGTTRLEPPCRGDGNVPSDARVAAAYHAHLRHNEGQYIEPRELIASLESLGGQALHSGNSHWVIPPEEPFHLWMVDFLAAGSARALWAHGFDAAAWRERALARRATVVAENVDLLLRLPAATALGAQLVARPAVVASPLGAPPPAAGTYSALEFVAPRTVALRPTPIPTELPPTGVAIRSEVSMVSTGTELLIYRGQFDVTDEPLDATIKGLSEERLSFPMAYGYSLVGRIVAVGSEVPSTAVGRRVFAFAPHAEMAFATHEGVQTVPDGISAADASFLPAAETALSIVHDAHPRASEVVHVYGAGLIGLLVIATLRDCGVTVVSVEPAAGRRALALRMGAHSAFHPGQAPQKAADVSIECSGAPPALQGAIDGTADTGRVVIASWYGKKPVGLSLGTRFHRSHIELIASQVSAITGGHASRWSKARRFSAAWELLRRVKPSTSLPVLTLPLAEAGAAYQQLDQPDGGGMTVVHFEYDAGEAAEEDRRRARTDWAALRAKF